MCLQYNLNKTGLTQSLPDSQVVVFRVSYSVQQVFLLVAVFIGRVPIETSFQSEGVQYLELSPDYDPPSPFSGVLYFEQAVFVLE